VRVVLDTNVLIAAFIARGVCHDLLEHCALNHELITSDFILNEVSEKLSDKFNYPAELVDEVDTLLRSRMQLVKPANLDAPICRDPDDDNILASALAGNCECIVTGDKVLLVLRQFEGIRIFNPRDFASFESSL
jgi:putative PIN family toxin of toxin-antitoxin system